MKVWSIISVILLSSVAFAQGINDIGRTLFVELLNARNYPGSPFSGNPVNDIILFFLVPTILIIMIIYMMVGRIFPVGYKSLRLLLGIGAYLFIIASGYYGFFMQLAGPTFIFFIFILGVLFFFLEFVFSRRGGGGTRVGGGGARGAGATLENVGESLAKQLVLKQIQLKEQEAGLKSARTANDPRTGDYESRVAEIRAEIKVLEGEIRLNPAERIAYNALRHKYRV